VFVGPGLTSFEQLAAGAGRRGVATAWVGYPYPWLRRVRAHAFVPRVASASDVQGLTTQLRRLGSHRIVDIQASEYVLTDVVAAARAAGVTDALLAELERRLRLSDKLVMSRRLAQRGVLVPPALDAIAHPAQEAVERLGTPLVVKGRVGNGGSSVRIVGSAAEAAAAALEVGVQGGAFYEQYVEGETVSYSASYLADGRVLHDAVYVTERISARRTGPPDRIRTVAEPAVAAAGRRVVGALGGAGLVNVNLITDAAGRAWVHDVNLRPWGTLLALREAGVDFAADYLHVLGLAGRDPDAAEVVVGRTCDVFPSAALAVAEAHPVTGFTFFAGQLPRYAAWAGLGYVVAELARTAAVVGRDRLRRGRSTRA
jgi:biotin carboxylase